MSNLLIGSFVALLLIIICYFVFMYESSPKKLTEEEQNLVDIIESYL